MITKEEFEAKKSEIIKKHTEWLFKRQEVFAPNKMTTEIAMRFLADDLLNLVIELNRKKQHENRRIIN